KQLFTETIAELEAYCKEIKKQLLTIPLTPKRRKELEKLSFQRVIEAFENINLWFGISTLKDFSDDEKNKLKILFQKRHLLTHNGGRVDQEYLDKTKDKSAKLNQTINIIKHEIEDLLNLIYRCVENLYNDFMTIHCS
ncbi:MAG: hypothetical protein KAX15_01595, partial [Candidatus Omnitrophica bacterium]|nr:hypothetical protein [Candidatus Omnitrophota bacterium]